MTAVEFVPAPGDRSITREQYYLQRKLERTLGSMATDYPSLVVYVVALDGLSLPASDGDGDGTPCEFEELTPAILRAQEIRGLPGIGPLERPAVVMEVPAAPGPPPWRWPEHARQVWP